MDKIAVLVPCYNEAVTIGKVVRDYREALPECTVYVYDNNSSDDTAKEAEKAGAVVRREYQQGKGNVIRRMFREIDAECYIMVDGDDTYPAQNAKEMARLVLEEQADMVIGDRLSSTYFTENKRAFHNFGNAFVRKIINLLFRSEIKDIMTGYRAFSYQFVKSFPVLSRGFEIETEMSIHAIDKNMALRHVVVDYRDRPEGSESKLNTYSDGCKVVWTVIRLYKYCRPMLFFGALSVLLFLLATFFFIPVFGEYLQSGMVERFPTLIVCGFVVIASIQSFFTGMILETMMKKNRQDFEQQLIYLAGQFKQLKGASDELQ